MPTTIRLRPLVALTCTVLVGCAYTPDVAQSFGEGARDGVVAWEQWSIGGVQQDVLIRGRSGRLPVAIVLHGGPGVSATALFRHYVPKLEDHFIMVYWDQPGTGRSFSRAALRGLSVDKLLDDLNQLVDRLRSRFGQRRVVLIAHSWGSALGTLYARRHPDKVAAYVGIGQVADMRKGEALSYRYAFTRAQATGNEQALDELRRVGEPPHDVERMLVSRRWVERLGGTFAGNLSTGTLIAAALSVPEATVIDLIRFGLGNQASLQALWPEFSSIDLTTSVAAVDVPMVFLLGARDQVTPSQLALRYLEELRAPCKRAEVVEGAGHNLPFEKPDIFVATLAKVSQQLQTVPSMQQVCSF